MMRMMSPSPSGRATAPPTPPNGNRWWCIVSVSEPPGQPDHALHDEHEDEHGGDQDARHGGDAHVERALHRSEEHTSELQSHSDLVCRLLLEKKKKIL